ncbi:MAG: tryptophan--tRNA ligase [Rhodospirillales bacterium]|nr:tryptophan--tRNA ligase [Alphaproteobacteria bacterium]MCB9986153.1 tryptophan--tRNA ligase [Rhodospirillales bacterium]USO07289.1 MAG: tryptophan--tRNA ligase [Rhodospirillales bacterium]
MKDRIFSGMQPTNKLHLGNYLGALKNWVKLQNEDIECIYCVVDLHAVTMPYDPAALAQATREIAAAYIAAGIDTKKSILFPQSAVSAHAQLNWLLSTMTQVGKLDRMTQFKDKGGDNREKVGLGLYAYPVLMAADILAYRATHVPVGDDQSQHLELTREIARTFNHRYKTEFFPEPKTVLVKDATRVMSLTDGTKKMSKSDPSDNSRINLTDDADAIAKKIRKAKSDALPFPANPGEEKDRPEVQNLITLYTALSGETRQAVMDRFGGGGFAPFKESFADVAVAALAPVATRMNGLLADPAEIDRILKNGAERADAIAAPILDEAFRVMGFWRA